MFFFEKMLKIIFFYILCICSILAFAPWLNEGKPNSTLIEGDIALEDAPDSNEQRSAIGDYQVHASPSSTWNRKWVNNTVPYTLSRDFSADQELIIFGAMYEIHQKTCISFVKRVCQKDFILFQNVSNISLCSSLLGRESGRQHVNLTDECVEHSTVLHVLMHVLGFPHVHSRHDRDKDNLLNVKSTYKQHLELIRKVDPMDSYDHKSITHYEFYAYNDVLSEIDVQKINNMYNCSNKRESVESSSKHTEDTITNVLNIGTTTVDVDQQRRCPDETNASQRTTSQLSTIQSTIKQVQTTSSMTVTETSIGTISKTTASTTTRPISILNNEIIKAVEEGNEATARKLLNEGADVNAKDNMDWTPLLHAASKGYVNIVSLLLDKGANIEARTTSNWTPLYYAARDGHVNIVSLLLDKGAKIEPKDATNETPLHFAASSGHVNIVSLLLDKGANIYAKARWKCHDFTPLDIAKRKSKPEIVEILKQILSKEIIKAVEQGNEAAVRKLLNEGADVNARTIGEYRNNTLLHIATEKGHENVVSLLLAHGANVSIKDVSLGEAAIHIAAKSGYANIVYLLLAHNVSVESKGEDDQTPLHYAALRGHANVVSLLVYKGANIEARNIYNQTSLHYAALNGYVNVVSLLLDKGANTFAKEHWNSTPLDLAKRKNETEIVEILERKEILNKEIIKAVEVGNEAKVRTLLNEGADVNAKDNMDWTPILHAASKGHVNVVSLLLDKGANIEARDESNWTPLHWAVNNSHVNVVSLLLGKGANIFAKGNQHETPLNLAKQRNISAIEEILVRKQLQTTSSMTVTEIFKSTQMISESRTWR